MEIIITENHLSTILNEVKTKSDERDKIYQDDSLLVVAPLTHRASCKYGAFTNWCTSVPSNDEHFVDHMNHGVLIYFIVKPRFVYGKNPELKFAYYKSFGVEGYDLEGWYDMKDNDLREDDMNLIKNLVPQKVFDMVNDYIKQQKIARKDNSYSNKIPTEKSVD
jgi:hypothetical protein